MVTGTEIYHRALDLFEKLQPGDGTFFSLPKEQPGRRVTTQRINHAAHKVFGAGNYQMRSSDSGVEVMRKGTTP